jgi:hypothetical protein
MKPLPLSAYGLLLTFDGYGADAARCTDEQLLLKVLRELPALIQMRRLGEPHLVRVDEPGIAGLSGFTFIMESHISIHTYAERGFVTLTYIPANHSIRKSLNDTCAMYLRSPMRRLTRFPAACSSATLHGLCREGSSFTHEEYRHG